MRLAPGKGASRRLSLELCCPRSAYCGRKGKECLISVSYTHLNTNLHVHMRLDDRYGNAHGGHLVEGTKVLLTVDVMLAEVDGLVMGRKFDNELEVPLFAPRQN